MLAKKKGPEKKEPKSAVVRIVYRMGGATWIAVPWLEAESWAAILMDDSGSPAADSVTIPGFDPESGLVKNVSVNPSTVAAVEVIDAASLDEHKGNEA